MPHYVSRRRFVQGLAVGGVLASFPRIVQADSMTVANTLHGTAPEFSGKVIELTIGESLVNFTGVVRKATTINGSIPAPTLRLREGDEVTIKVTNTLSVPSSIHWQLDDADQNGDGFICGKHVGKDGKVHVHTDNNLPLN